MMFAPVLALLMAAADPGLAALQAADARLASVAWRLQTANVALCADVAPLPGFTVQALTQYPAGERARVARDLGLDGRPAVAAVASRSAAARAGVAAGDKIVAIDGVAAPGGDDGRKAYDQVASTEDRVEAAFADRTADLTLERAGVVRRVLLAGDRGCASRVQLVPEGDLNAGADGRYVQITGQMYEFAAGDDELATIVAHELAHNVLRHRARLDAAGVSRGLFRGMGRSGEAFRRTEYEADRLGVWLMARAGFDERAAPAFWRRLGERTGTGLFSSGTHPRWRDRIARVEAAVAEVQAQRAGELPLLPTPEEPASQAKIRR